VTPWGISIHTGWYVDSTQESETQGLAGVPARAGQPQAGLNASVLRGGVTPLHTNRFVCSEANPQFDCKHVDAREPTEGLMERGKAQICPSEWQLRCEIHPT